MQISQKQKPKKPVPVQPARQIDIVPAAGTVQPAAAKSAEFYSVSNTDYFLIAGFLIFAAAIIFKKFFGKNRSNNQAHGTAAWARTGEIQDLLGGYQPGQIEVAKIRDWGTTRMVRLPRDLALRHVLIAAPTGVGKSRSYFLPNCHGAGKTSFICTDPKSEIWELTAYNQTRPIRFAPGDPDNSASFNFIEYCKNIQGAQNCAAVVVNSKGKADPRYEHWTNTEVKLCAAAFLHVAYSQAPTPLHVYKIIVKGPDTVCDVLGNSDNEDVRDLMNSYINEDETFRGSILSGLTGKLQFLQNPNIQRFTSSTTTGFDFAQLRDVPTQIYWCLAEDDIEQLQPLTALFFSIAMRQLVAATSRKIPVSFFFDEFANIGRIVNFEKKISILRGQGISLSAGLQSVSQLTSVYGDTDAKTILENFTTILILDSLKLETAEQFSKALGEFTYSEESESTSKSGGVVDKKVSESSSIKQNARRLITADEIRRLDKKKIIVLSGNLKPVRGKRLFFFNPAPELLAKKIKTPRCPAEIIPVPVYQIIEKSKGKGKRENTAASLAECIAASTGARAEHVSALLDGKPQPKPAQQPKPAPAATPQLPKSKADLEALKYDAELKAILDSMSEY